MRSLGFEGPHVPNKCKVEGFQHHAKCCKQRQHVLAGDAVGVVTTKYLTGWIAASSAVDALPFLFFKWTLGKIGRPSGESLHSPGPLVSVTLPKHHPQRVPRPLIFRCPAKKVISKRTTIAL